MLRLNVGIIPGIILLFALLLPPATKAQASGEDSIAEDALLPVITAFADSYAASMTQSNILLQQRLKNNTDRLTAYRMMVHSLAAAYDTAVLPNSATAVLDMTVMVTLQRIVWEEFWYPQKFGDSARPHLMTLRQLEKEIWAIAENILTPDQQRELRNLILQWRKTHPDQQIVHSIRLSTFREELGMGLDDPKGLFSRVSKAVDTAEEMRLLGEKYRYMASRMQLMLNSQLQMAYLQLVSRPEVNRLLNDTNRLTASVEQFAESVSRLPDTTKGILKTAGAESEQFRRLVEEAHDTLVVGKEMINLVNDTLETTDSLVARFDPIREQKQGAEPIDISVYRDTAKDVTETLRQLNHLVQSLDQFLISPDRADRLSELMEAIGSMTQMGEGLIDHFFYRAVLLSITLLIGIILAALSYRYLSERLPGTDRG